MPSVTNLQHCTITRLLVFVVGEWEAPLDKDAFRPDQLGSHAFSKFDSHRAVLFGGNGSLVYSNTCYIFDLDTRVRYSIAMCYKFNLEST